MAENKYNASLKDLIDKDPEAWGRYLAHHLHIDATEFEVLKPDAKQFQVLDSDVSTALRTDKLFQVGPKAKKLIHLELEGSGDLGLPKRLQIYNILAERHHKMLVKSVAILLREEKNPSDVTGEYIVRDDSIPLPEPGQPDPGLIHHFRYHVIRLWEESLDDLMAFGLNLLPLALLTRDGNENLQQTFARAENELRKSDLADKIKGDLMSLMINIGGLAHKKEVLGGLYMSVGNILEESWVFQDIKGKGHVEGRVEGEVASLVKNILRLGTKRFGTPESSVQEKIQLLTDVPQLEQMLDNVLTATSWDDILKI